MNEERLSKEIASGTGETKDEREQGNYNFGEFKFDHDYKDTSNNAEIKPVTRGNDYFACGKFDFDMFKDPKGTLVKEITLCTKLSLQEFSISYSNKSTAKKSTEFGKRACAPARGGLYVEIEPSKSSDTEKQSKTPLEASSNIAVTANIDTRLLALGKPSIKTSIEITIKGEFAKFKSGLEWGCVGNSIKIEHSNRAGVKVDLNFSNAAPQRLY